MLLLAVVSAALQLKQSGYLSWGASWLSGETGYWSHRKSHVITSASGAGTNYQVNITVHYGSGTDSGEDVYLNGKCRTDFGDVRFVDYDEETALDYCLKSKVDGNYAVFEVEVADDLSSDPATIYVYYGKSDATTTSDGFSTYTFFDDFASDRGWWTQYNYPYTIENGVMKTWSVQYGCGAFAGDTELTSGVIEGRAKYISGGAYGSFAALCFRYGASYFPDYFGYFAFYPAEDKVRFMWRNYYGGTVIINETDYVSEADTWYNLKIVMVGDSLTGYINDVPVLSMTDTSNHKGMMGVFSGGSCEFDDISVGKYVYPSPSHGSWGSEESDAEPPVISAFTKSPSSPKTGQTVTFTAQAADNFDVSKVEINFTETYSTVNVVNKAVEMNYTGSGTWSLEVSYASACSVTAQAIAYDAEGNTDSETLQFSVAYPSSTSTTTTTVIVEKPIYELPRGNPSFDITVTSTSTVWLSWTDALVTVRLVNVENVWDEVQLELWLVDEAGNPKFVLMQDAFKLGSGNTQIVVPCKAPLAFDTFRLQLTVNEEYGNESYKVTSSQAVTVVPLPLVVAGVAIVGVAVVLRRRKKKSGGRKK